MKSNKKSNGFTLVELLAAVIILGVIMLIAIPNVLSTMDRNKKDSFIQDARRLISAAEYKIRGDVSIEYPNATGITLLTLDKINTSEVLDSPYDTKYSKSKSFVAIILDSGEYVYYVHLVACTNEACDASDERSVGIARGINLASNEELINGSRFDEVVKGTEVEYNLIANQARIKTLLGNKTGITVY